MYNLLTEEEIRIPTDSKIIRGDLVVPKRAKGIVIFAHGSGSSRFSTHNRFVANVLQENRLATLLIDLLTTEEEMVDNITAQFRFDIDLISQRLLDITYFVEKNSTTKKLPIGYFGASTGAAAAISAAARLPQKICAVVSRGGRPDLVGDDLKNISCPTLFIIGGHDFLVVDVNKQAFKQLVHVSHKDIKIIPKATHLFEEPGALEKVAKEASDWFIKYL